MFNNHQLECSNNKISKDLSFHLRTILLNTKLNFLLGAGFSFWSEDSLEKYQGFPIMKLIFQTINRNQDKIFKKLQEKEEFKRIFETENIEDLLTQLEKDISFKNEKEIIEKEFKKILIIKQQEKLEKFPKVWETYAKFYDLLKYITLNVNENSKNNTINIFTTNYDLYSEMVLEEKGIKYYSGFSGFFLRKFNSSYYDYGYYESTKLVNYNFYRKRDYINLIKLHGSLSWSLNENGELIELPFFYLNNDLNPAIVLPSFKKYSKVTYENYYFELQFYFKQTIFLHNSSLLVFGTQMGDLHINKILEDAYSIKGTNIIVFCRNQQEYKTIEKKYSNFLYFYPKYDENWTCLQWILFLCEVIYIDKDLDIIRDNFPNFIKNKAEINDEIDK